VLILRALSKIVHNACKFTDKGYIHITVQDVSRDVVLPAGYDNSIRTSVVSIDIKDSGRGSELLLLDSRHIALMIVTPEFLESEVLRPFTKADSFTPGSGLGLGLAQRMIELLGGKLAIASTPGKGTLVHVEVPMHLYNEDNDSDQDEMAAQNDNADSNASRPDRTAEKIRQDGIYLVGFEGSAGIKRVGKCLLRLLKLNFCRVVPDLQYASLIVAPDHVDESVLIQLAKRARPRVEIATIGDRPRYRTSPLNKSTLGDPTSAVSSLEGEGVDGEMIGGFPVRRFSRPLRPSILAGIMRPPKSETPLVYYSSPVVGGEQTMESWGRVLEGRQMAMAASADDRPRLNRMESVMTNNTTTTTTETSMTNAGTETSGSLAEDLEIAPSPNGSPRLGDLREMGPIPAGMRTIKADFESALPIIEHDRRGSGMYRRKTPMVEKTQEQAWDWGKPGSGSGSGLESVYERHISGGGSYSSDNSEEQSRYTKGGSSGFGSRAPNDSTTSARAASSAAVSISASARSIPSVAYTHSSEDPTAPHKPVSAAAKSKEREEREKERQGDKGKEKALKVKSGLDDGTELKERLRGEYLFLG